MHRSIRLLINDIFYTTGGKMSDISILLPLLDFSVIYLKFSGMKLTFTLCVNTHVTLVYFALRTTKRTGACSKAKWWEFRARSTYTARVTGSVQASSPSSEKNQRINHMEWFTFSRKLISSYSLLSAHNHEKITQIDT